MKGLKESSGPDITRQPQLTVILTLFQIEESLCFLSNLLDGVLWEFTNRPKGIGKVPQSLAVREMKKGRSPLSGISTLCTPSGCSVVASYWIKSFVGYSGLKGLEAKQTNE
jgi:hypothetical protein